MRILNIKFIFLLLLSFNACSQINNNEIKIIREFYTIHLNQLNDKFAEIDEIDSVIKQYCSTRFVKEIYEVDWGREFIICAQDIGDKWIKTMKIKKHNEQDNLFIVTFYDNDINPQTHNIKVKLIEKNNQFKIDNVICID